MRMHRQLRWVNQRLVQQAPPPLRLAKSLARLRA